MLVPVPRLFRTPPNMAPPELVSSAVPLAGPPMPVSSGPQGYLWAAPETRRIGGLEPAPDVGPEPRTGPVSEDHMTLITQQHHQRMDRMERQLNEMQQQQIEHQQQQEQATQQLIQLVREIAPATKQLIQLVAK